AELELALGEDHPLRRLAAQLALLDAQLAARHQPARRHDGDGGAGAEVPRAADDRARLAVADVDLRQLQLVGVRMRDRLEHLADDEVVEVAVPVGHAAAHDAVDLARGEHELTRELLERQLEVDVLAQPADRDLHQNCPRTRRSFSQNRRRSGRPWRSMAMRSMPKPNAKPCHSAGSRFTLRNTSGSTQPAPPISIQPECLHVAQPPPPQMKQVTSNSTDGSVNGEWRVRMRTSRSAPNSARKNCSTVPCRSASVMPWSTARHSPCRKIGECVASGVSRR